MRRPLKAHPGPLQFDGAMFEPSLQEPPYSDESKFALSLLVAVGVDLAGIVWAPSEVQRPSGRHGHYLPDKRPEPAEIQHFISGSKRGSHHDRAQHAPGDSRRPQC